MERIFISLQMDLSDHAPEGAGWYLTMYQDNTPVMAPMPVDPNTALRLATVYHQAMQASPYELPSISPQALVQSGSKLIYESLQKQLAEAEQAAARVAILRQRLQAATPKPLTTPGLPATVENNEQ